MISKHFETTPLNLWDSFNPRELKNGDIAITADQRALGALLEVLPTNVAPETLVWVHLEGLRRREAA